MLRINSFAIVALHSKLIGQGIAINLTIGSISITTRSMRHIFTIDSPLTKTIPHQLRRSLRLPHHAAAAANQDDLRRRDH